MEKQEWEKEKAGRRWNRKHSTGRIAEWEEA
jgi:hypothetical protein